METIETIKTAIMYVGHRLFERKLLDMCGGNISARQDDRIFITARYSGGQRHWQNQAEDILEADINSDALLSHPHCSRESNAHLLIYRHMPDVGAVIHAHPFHVLPFCAAARPIDPILEQTQKFGQIQVVQQAPAHSLALAKNVVETLQGQEEAIRKQAAAVILPQHGIIVAGKDLLAAADTVERIDWNAWCILAQKLMPQ